MKTTEQNEIGLAKLDKDLRNTVATMTRDEARQLVYNYYTMQKKRMCENLQVVSAEKTGKQHAVLEFFREQSEFQEKQIALALKAFAESQPMGVWAMKVKGIGPVIAAGLCAHIDIEKCQTVGAIWRFAGVDPTSKWEKGEKRPFNAALKTLVWKIGESFLKVSNHPDSQYGKLYRERKAYEEAKNEAGEYKAQAAAVLKSRPTHAQKKFYKEGKLPPGHLNARAKRYAAKLFLSHWFEEAYRQRWGKEPPLPYPIAHLGHVHRIEANSCE